MSDAETPAPAPKVSVGDVVLYHYAGPFLRGPGVPHPAMVVFVHSDGKLDLTEFRPGSVEHRRGVQYSAEPAPFSWRPR